MISILETILIAFASFVLGLVWGAKVFWKDVKGGADK